MSSYKELSVWKKAFEMCECIYKATQDFPKEELYGLTSQIRRAAISIPSNIAEGSKRGKKEFIYFLKIAHGSGAEIETQLLLANRMGHISPEDFSAISSTLEEVMKMLESLIKKFLSTTP